MSDRLTGQELLAHVKKQLSAGYTVDDAARTAGYIKGKLERTDKVAYELAFHQALGIEVPVNSKATAPRKRKPTGTVSVFKSGSTSLSAAYMTAIGARPGDQFNVVAEGNTITLTLMGPGDDEEEDEDYDESEEADEAELDVVLVAA